MKASDWGWPLAAETGWSVIVGRILEDHHFDLRKEVSFAAVGGLRAKSGALARPGPVLILALLLQSQLDSIV